MLGPIHKSGPKNDPNNFRGICVSSCLGKVFNSLLRNRLEKKCIDDNIIHQSQISGKKAARTADHLLVLHFLIKKYLKCGSKQLFVCFFDLRKAFDTVNRTHLFYELISNYGIGGRFLDILQNIYKENYMYVKLQQGLTNPFITTCGVCIT